MPTYAGARMPPPDSWEEFENIVCSAAQNRWDNPNFALNGRNGQRQDGVDIYGTDHNGQYVGIQCKNSTSQLAAKAILAEVVKARSFAPQLTYFFIATTMDSDVHLQRAVRKISTDEKNNSGFQVGILSWPDIWADLVKDESRLFKHYPQLKPAPSGVILRSPTNTFTFPQDVKLFELFQKEIQHETVGYLLTNHDFNYPFLRAHSDPLFQFVEEWRSPYLTFKDPVLQEKLVAFYQAARNLAIKIAELTVPINRTQKYASVYSDHERSMSGPRPQRLIDEAKQLNEVSAQCLAAYEAFIKTCRLVL